MIYVYIMLQRYNDEVENLDGQSVDDDVLDDKLRFYMENINGMTLEVDELRGLYLAVS